MLSIRLLDYLTTKKGLRIIGDRSADKLRRVPIISFVVQHVESYDVPRAIDPYKIGIRYGDFYANNLIANLGLISVDGVVRVRMVHYHTVEKVDCLIQALDEVLPVVRKNSRVQKPFYHSPWYVDQFNR